MRRSRRGATSSSASPSAPTAPAIWAAALLIRRPRSPARRGRPRYVEVVDARLPRRAEVQRALRARRPSAPCSCQRTVGASVETRTRSAAGRDDDARPARAPRTAPGRSRTGTASSRLPARSCAAPRARTSRAEPALAGCRASRSSRARPSASGRACTRRAAPRTHRIPCAGSLTRTPTEDVVVAVAVGRDDRVRHASAP